MRLCSGKCFSADAPQGSPKHVFAPLANISLANVLECFDDYIFTQFRRTRSDRQKHLRETSATVLTFQFFIFADQRFDHLATAWVTQTCGDQGTLLSRKSQ